MLRVFGLCLHMKTTMTYQMNFCSLNYNGSCCCGSVVNEPVRTWVWSLASLCGLRIQRCHELWCRLQMQLGSCIAVAVAQLDSYSSDSTPSLGTSICHGFGPKRQNKTKKNHYNELTQKFENGCVKNKEVEFMLWRDFWEGKRRETGKSMKALSFLYCIYFSFSYQRLLPLS